MAQMENTQSKERFWVRILQDIFRAAQRIQPILEELREARVLREAIQNVRSRLIAWMPL